MTTYRINMPENDEIQASSASGPFRSIRPGHRTDHAFLVHLQKAWSANVGFLPATALLRYLDNGQVLVVEENGQLAGYLIWTFRPDGLVRLPQVAIEAELLRTTLGSRLMRRIVTAARKNHCSVVRLKSRSDIPANRFWPEFGFTATAVIARPTSRGLPLIEWTLQLADSATIADVMATGGKHFKIGKAPPPTAPHVRPS